MSDTPKLPDECKKLLDNGWTIALFANAMGSYTAAAIKGPPDKIILELVEDTDDDHCTDDFEPSQALYRLTEKVFGNIV